MKKVAKVILSVLTVALLLALCLVIGAMSAATVHIHLLCSLILYSFGWCVTLTKNAIAWAKDNIGFAHNKEVVFRIEPDSPNGIKLSDIADGQCSEYNGVNLQGVLQYAICNNGTGARAFPNNTPMCFVSSGRHFLGCGNIIYPVQPPIKRPARLSLYWKKFKLADYTWPQDGDNPADDGDAIREIVLKTNFAVTGPRTNDVRLQYKDNRGSNISRVRLIAPSVVLSKTGDMTPIRVALLSPYVVRDDSKSVFLRRYIALARVYGGEDGRRVAHGFQKDIRANMQQFTHICAYERGALSQVDATFMRVSMDTLRAAANRFSKCSVAELERHSRHVLLLLGLSQSEDEMFKPLTEASKVWLMSEFIHLQSFQDAVISAAMASMASSVDGGVVSREDILKGMPYLCKQIPGLCEAVYAIVRAAKYGNSVCEEGNLSNIALYSMANMLYRYGVQLPSMDEDSAFEGMNDRARRDFDTFVEQILRACRLLPHSGDTSSMCGTAWQVLRDGRCSNVIACLVAYRVSSLLGFSGKSVNDLCIPAASDEFIIDHIKANSAPRSCAPERWIELELADKQELEISSDTSTKVYEFPGFVYPPASDTSLDSSEVAAVRAESRTTRLATGAVSM
ncbi:hypothetical protein AOV_01885 [Anaplasma ovis str. Haibei]|uniref:Uncharacterized protein n=1 Tax=Anaplasma ovis str. Haibei TaxID=1248439 RepID=A0A2Z2LGD2_9RICK|nr:hypothetical protein [Anaplasma ovis]ASI47634.1 hypothetical protein AOV_01885 [Anaplasma ovis str. Haibei]